MHVDNPQRDKEREIGGGREIQITNAAQEREKGEREREFMHWH